MDVEDGEIHKKEWIEDSLRELETYEDLFPHLSCQWPSETQEISAEAIKKEACRRDAYHLSAFLVESPEASRDHYPAKTLKKGNHRADSIRPGALGSTWRALKPLAGTSRQMEAIASPGRNKMSFPELPSRSTDENSFSQMPRRGFVLIRTPPRGLEGAKYCHNALTIVYIQRHSFLKYGAVESNGAEEVVKGVYGNRLSTGPTSTFFNVEGTASSSGSWAPREDQFEFPFTVQRLGQRTTLGDFLANLRVLKRVNSAQHPHIVKMRSAFFDEFSEKPVFMFAFHRALGSLEQLFQGVFNNTNVVSSINTSVRHAFLGLASALTHLHDVCHMAHGNIEPSSILVYTDMKNDDLVLKLADFGMAIDLSDIATEEVVAAEFASTSPALAKAQRADFRNKHTSADVWMLGYVLMELSVFADRGSHGVLHLRTHLETEAELDRTERFNGKHINYLMELIQGGYISPRIFAMRQSDAFRNEEWRSLNVCLYTLLSSRVNGITARELCKSLMKVPGQRHYDGTRFVELYPCVDSPRVSITDLIRLRIEKWTQNQIDWSPLPPVSNLCCQGEMRVDWKYEGRKISVTLSADQADRYKSYCFPALRDRSPILPISKRNDRDNADLHSTIHQPSQRPIPGDTEARINAAGPAPSNIETPASVANVPLVSKEVYWCVDKFFSEPKEIIREPISLTDVSTDDQFYSHTRHALGRTRGPLLSGFIGGFDWLRNRLSWKTCVGVEFTQFYIIKDGHDQVLLGDIGLPPLGNLGKGPSEYEHAIHPPDDIQMKLVAAQIMSGLRHPDEVQGETEMISLLPKKRVPPDFNKKMRTMGWGMHAQMGLSVKKMLWWLLFCVVSLIISAAPWLIWVDRFDLQNAFMPGSTILAVLTICVAVAQTVG